MGVSEQHLDYLKESVLQTTIFKNSDSQKTYPFLLCICIAVTAQIMSH